jgi:hypothetical protein
VVESSAGSRMPPNSAQPAPDRMRERGEIRLHDFRSIWSQSGAEQGYPVSEPLVIVGNAIAAARLVDELTGCALARNAPANRITRRARVSNRHFRGRPLECRAAGDGVRGRNRRILGCGPGPPARLPTAAPGTPTPERCVEAYYLQRTRFEGIAERKLRRRQLIEDGNFALGANDGLRERQHADVHLDHAKTARRTRNR